ncbi:MAG: hypothetical protein MR368_05725 [Azospirillum sp.]|nr:hypothetical protein [Azospirillum sp.]
MIKNKYFYMVLACVATVVGAFPAFAGLPTMDAGNIAGTVGIVAQGQTGIQQGIETIANGSNLNAIVGDSAGTLAKFTGKLGIDPEKAKKALETAQNAQKRISEGMETYNKYQGEIAKRQEEYQALMDMVNSKVGKDSYDDSDEEGEYEGEESAGGEDEEYGADYDSDYDSDYDAESVSTLETAEGFANSETYQQATTQEMLATPVTSEQSFPISAQVSPVSAELQRMDALQPLRQLDVKAVDTDLDKVVEEDADGTDDADAEQTDEPTDTVEKISTPTITNATTGRTRFGGLKQAVTAAAANAKLNKVSVQNKMLSAAKNSTAKTTLKSAVKSALESKNLSSSVAKQKAVATTQPATAVRKFRVSPTLKTAPSLKTAPAMKIERMSNSTISFSSKMMFADEAADNTKGVGIDSKGTFISPLAQRCGISIKDLQDAEKIKECTTKIVSENNAKNQYDAINSRKDCQSMVYSTVVALLAEATQGKYESSNYGDTLDKQEDLGADSNNTRDDTMVIALTNEQTQILLNKMSLLVSAQTILSSVKYICEAPKDVLEKTTDDKNDGAKTDGGK